MLEAFVARGDAEYSARLFGNAEIARIATRQHELRTATDETVAELEGSC